MLYSFNCGVVSLCREMVERREEEREGEGRREWK